MTARQANDPEPFNVPLLGRHYQEVWDEEDMHMPFNTHAAAAAASSADPPDALPPRDKRLANRPKKFVPVRDMGDEDLYDDLKGLGGLAERMLSSMVREEGHAHGRGGGAAGPSKHAAVVSGEATNGASPAVPSITVNGASLANGHAGSSTAPPSNDGDVYDWPIEPHKITNRGDKERANAAQVDMVELEEGLRRELRHLGLLGVDEEVGVNVESAWCAASDTELMIAATDRLHSAARRRNHLGPAAMSAAITVPDRRQRRAQEPPRRDCA